MPSNAAAIIGAQVATAAVTPIEGYWRGVIKRLLRDRVAIACALLLLVVVLAAIFAPWVAPADPIKGSVLKRLQPIGSPGFILGSDELGRDMLSRLIYGGRLSPA